MILAVPYLFRPYINLLLNCFPLQVNFHTNQKKYCLFNTKDIKVNLKRKAIKKLLDIRAKKDMVRQESFGFIERKTSGLLSCSQSHDMPNWRLCRLYIHLPFPIKRLGTETFLVLQDHIF